VAELAALSRTARRQESRAAPAGPGGPVAGPGQAASVASPVNASQSEA
jgi:hypothetical protein